MPAGHFADGQLLRERDEVGLGEREARDDLVAAATPASSQPTVAGVSATSRNAAKYAPLRLGRGLRGQPARSTRSTRGAACAPVGVGRERPVGVLQVGQDPLDVQLVGLARQRADREIEKALRGELAVEHASHSVTQRASARQRVARSPAGVATATRGSARRGEFAVADAAAVGQDEQRRRKTAAPRDVGSDAARGVTDTSCTRSA